MTTSVRALSWHDGVCASALTRFVPYPLHKFRLTLSFSYLWLWHLSVLTLYHFLSADYVCVWLVNLFFFSLCLHTVETFFPTILRCVHVLSYPISFCIHNGLNSFSSCLHVGMDFFLVWPNPNKIYNTFILISYGLLCGFLSTVDILWSNYFI